MAAPRPVTPADIPMLAQLHVACWAEAYAGLLPPEEIAARDVVTRTRQWTYQIAQGTSRIALIPGLGFAQAGAQRDDALRDAGYPQELFAIYLLRKGQGRGLGRTMLRAVTDLKGGPMTALVLGGNDSAIGFYEATGAHRLDSRSEQLGQTTIIKYAYGWSNPADI